ncbi:MAG: 50S ribosome-binding GTPase [Bacteroidales bacterium]|nr:50S ribosome-binding GTPase [Bacteroidales bacterium]
MSNELSNYRLDEFMAKVPVRPLDIMLVGVTGAGKSSTIDALIGSETAKIGYGVNPETQDFNFYFLNDYVRLWDTPGIGDSPQKDAILLQNVATYLNEIVDVYRDNVLSKPCYLIDMVLVVIDGSRRELGGIFKLLNQTILNNIDDNRIIFAINQADVAMSGRHWSNGRPDNVLIGYLNDQINSFQQRIESEIHRKIHRPICYSASQEYNVKALLDCVLDNMSDCERQTKL